MSRRERRAIATGFYADSVRSRARYTIKLVVGEFRDDLWRVPSDVRVVG